MLAELQQRLSDIYRVSPTYDVRDYVITDRILATVLGRDAMLTNTDETLLVSQEGDELALSLFLDEDLLSRVEACNPLDCLQAEQLDDLWKVVEGISHFNYVAWKAAKDRTFSLLELELQGEIDKFIMTMQLALSQEDTELSTSLHGWLFDNVSYHEELDDEQLNRYRVANDYAARFCHRLKDLLVNNDNVVFSELRRFYRLQLADKISHIHTRAWAAA